MAVLGFGIVFKSLVGLRSKHSAKLEICEGPGVSLLPAARITLCKVCGCTICVVGAHHLTWAPLEKQRGKRGAGYPDSQRRSQASPAAASATLKITKQA